MALSASISSRNLHFFPPETRCVFNRHLSTSTNMFIFLRCYPTVARFVLVLPQSQKWKWEVEVELRGDTRLWKRTSEWPLGKGSLLRIECTASGPSHSVLTHLYTEPNACVHQKQNFHILSGTTNFMTKMQSPSIITNTKQVNECDR